MVEYHGDARFLRKSHVMYAIIEQGVSGLFWMYKHDLNREKHRIHGIFVLFFITHYQLKKERRCHATHLAIQFSLVDMLPTLTDITFFQDQMSVNSLY